MGNKSWTLLPMAMIVLLVLACKPRGVDAQFRHAIEQADTLWAYKVDGYPTAAAEHKKGVRYVFDYEVQKAHPLLATEIAAMKAAVMNSTTFDTVALKSCPMVAQYAVAVHQRGKIPAAVIISNAPCGKALIFNQKHPNQPKSMELRIGNQLERLLAGLW